MNARFVSLSQIEIGFFGIESIVLVGSTCNQVQIRVMFQLQLFEER